MPNLFSNIFISYFSNRTSMARACASRPSVRANVVMCFATSSKRSFCKLCERRTFPQNHIRLVETRESRRTTSRQYVVCTAYIVTQWFRRISTEEYGACILNEAHVIHWIWQLISKCSGATSFITVNMSSMLSIMAI